MAKKNSTKTATKEALQASEPRMQTFTGWQGVNFKDSPLGWQPLEKRSTSISEPYRTSDLKTNFLLVQNNLETCDSKTIETRHDSRIEAKIDPWRYADGWRFTGVECLFHRWLFAVIRKSWKETVDGEEVTKISEKILWRDCSEDAPTEWEEIHLYDIASKGIDPEGYVIKEIGYFENNLVITTMHINDSNPDVYDGEVFICPLGYAYSPDIISDNASFTHIAERIDPGVLVDGVYCTMSYPRVPDPTDPCSARGIGEGEIGGIVWDVDDTKINYVSRLEFSYCFTNKLGFTKAENIYTTYASLPPETWNAGMFVEINGDVPNLKNLLDPDSPETEDYMITGVDVYVSMDNKQTTAYVGHYDFGTADNPDRVAHTGDHWAVNWLGGQWDTAILTNAPIDIPEENTTKGAPCSHFAIIDSRFYWWGDPMQPERLYIGGLPGNDFSVARSVGGGWIDIEPGTGIEINGLAKWKTAGGANIVTMMCGNRNTNMIKRYNLVEVNAMMTNEIGDTSWMYEEVSNVVGCNSRWGYGVFADGLYAVSRYGLVLTTMAMEYNNQMRTQKISDAIEPIFTDRIAKALDDCRLVCINGVLYLVLSRPDADDVTPSLDQVILCYDLDLKAWYTFTCDQIPKADGQDEKILHVFAFDSQDLHEGLGVITESEIRVYPTTGEQDIKAPEFNVLMETGELASRQPIQTMFYLCQLEFRFDYFIGECDIFVEGVDYYGRPFVVRKKCNRQEDLYNREYIEWIRIDKYVQSYRVRLIGPARFRLTHINTKAYVGSNKTGLVYGYDAHDSYHGHRNQRVENHHYIRDYNNLRDAIVP